MPADLVDAVQDEVSRAEPTVPTAPPALLESEVEPELDFAPARGIGAAVVLSVSFWLLFAFAFYLMR